MRRLPGSSSVVPLAGGEVVDLHSEAGAPDEETVRSLLDSSLLVEAGEDVPPGVVEALRRLPVPALFRASSWLRRCRVLVLDEGSTTLGAARISYRMGRGLRVDSADITVE
jgi:hypothetical protein